MAKKPKEAPKEESKKAKKPTKAELEAEALERKMEKRLRYLLSTECTEEIAYEKFDAEFSKKARTEMELEPPTAPVKGEPAAPDEKSKLVQEPEDNVKRKRA
jgi:hypothetical protein